MDVQEFVAETLRQVIAGVKDAQKSTRDSGAIINPPDVGLSDKTAVIGTAVVGGNWTPVLGVSFDVAVVVTDDISGKAGAKLSVAGLSAQIGGGAAQKTETTSRVQFRVPLVLPPDGAAVDACKDRRANEDAAVRRANAGYTP